MALKQKKPTFKQLIAKVHQCEDVVEAREREVVADVRQLKASWLAAWTPWRIVAAGLATGFVVGRAEAMRATRAEPGCLEYVMAADPVDPSRVVLFERWADQASFDAHMAVRAQGGSKATGPAPQGFEVKIYDVAGERAFG